MAEKSTHQPANQDQTDKPLLDLYKEICNNIRVTDDISFKLLGLVPILSGVGSTALTLIDKNRSVSSYSDYVVMSLSILGAVVTFGLFRWELRNIQKCNWLISRAAKLEPLIFKSWRDARQYEGVARDEHIRASSLNEISDKSKQKRSWGKTQSERLIYIAAIIAWLVPLAIVLTRIIPSFFFWLRTVLQ